MPDWVISLMVHPVTLVGVGGGAGANARYWLGQFVKQLPAASVFPWATFLINVIGSVALGFVATACLNHEEASRRNWYLLLGVGFCGGFTTFSTFSFETVKLVQDGKAWVAVVYVVASVVAGVAGVWAAVKLAGGPPAT